MGAAVESREGRLELHLLGPLRLTRAGVELQLPPSRKVRALLGYLTLAPHPVARTRLCELLWDAPDDPRGELRWCLSKLRSLLDAPERRRVQTRTDQVNLDLSDCFVDALEVVDASIATAELEQTRKLNELFRGDLLEGLELGDSPEFSSWLQGQRRRFRAVHIALLEQLVAGADEDHALEFIEQWLLVAPLDLRAHNLLLDILARRKRFQEGNAHVVAAAKQFEEEGLDASQLRDSWDEARDQPNARQRASVAVMPFVDVTQDRGIGDALAHDIITRLAKLRSLFVIAQGTVFALREGGIGPREAARMLGVDYIAGGFVQHRGDDCLITVELTETATGRILWTETYTPRSHDTLAILDEIGDNIVSSMAGEIEASERNRAVLRAPTSLNAWEAYHRALWHVYRFNKTDNEQARHFFQMAVDLDPTFARAYAGLSFTHFQNAFLGWTERAGEIDRAFETAGKSVMADDRDPTAHWAMGRALWLRGRCQQSESELEKTIELSPNFALAHYTLGFVRCQSGDPEAAIVSLDYSRRLSPYDPLLFAMYASHGAALARLGRFEEAAEFGAKGAARPNAHVHILAMAAYLSALAGRTDDAKGFFASTQTLSPGYDFDDLIRAFRFEPEAHAMFKRASKLIYASG
jgi:DNA-binding SARP family transcriptional activator/Tfp pilus assembly protein PilF